MLTNDTMNAKVYWFTGLSGAGKTTLARKFYEYIKIRQPNTVFLDGDILREIFNGDSGHSINERKKIAMRNAKLCKLLNDQNINVICATISMFHQCQLWNRENIKNYVEIYIKVPIEILVQRDQKGLYSRALKGEIQNVMGIDLSFEEPQNPDIIIENDNSKSIDEIFNALVIKI